MAKRMRSTAELAIEVSRDPKLMDEIKTDPVKTISNLAGPLESDVWVYRLVVSALGSAVLLAGAGAIALAAAGDDVPELLTAVGSGAVGAIAGLLARPPGSD